MGKRVDQGYPGPHELPRLIASSMGVPIGEKPSRAKYNRQSL
jgi:hypothetical protein